MTILKCIAKMERVVGCVKKETLLKSVATITQNLESYLEQLDALKIKKMSDHLRKKCKQFTERVQGENF